MKTVVVGLGAAVVLLSASGCFTRVVERQTNQAPAATVVTTPGQTVVVTTPAPPPHCAGSYSTIAGTNFIACGR